jgi:NtrC-family two-component system response regulator AlgB
MHATIELTDVRGTTGLAESMPIIDPHNTRMRRVNDRARHLAGDPAPLLLCGEFGVGKRLMARSLHNWGPRANSPCILVRAASADPVSSPREAAEHLRQAGSEGTLVFEEIGEFPPAQQDELLALIAANDAGDETATMLPFHVKIVATTSKDLFAAARKAEFREELLSHLMDETLYLPPLRERAEDIVTLAEHMLTHFGHFYHRPELFLEPEAKLALVRYPWPGNIHELRNTIERVVLTAKKPAISEAEFRLRPAPESSCHRSGDYLSLDAMEKQHILRVMRASSTLEEAARILQVDITTLWRKRRRYGI